MLTQNHWFQESQCAIFQKLQVPLGLHILQIFKTVNRHLLKKSFDISLLVTARKKSDKKGKIEKAPRSVDKLIDVWNSEENLSMVVVRHPLSRLGGK